MMFQMQPTNYYTQPCIHGHTNVFQACPSCLQYRNSYSRYLSDIKQRLGSLAAYVSRSPTGGSSVVITQSKVTTTTTTTTNNESTGTSKRKREPVKDAKKDKGNEKRVRKKRKTDAVRCQEYLDMWDKW